MTGGSLILPSLSSSAAVSSKLVTGGLPVVSGLTQPTVTEVENLLLSVGASVPQTGASPTSVTVTVTEMAALSPSGSAAVTSSACEVALS